MNTCPLCSKEFQGGECHSSCPMSSGCALVRCPNCGYEFPAQSRLVGLVKRLFNRPRLLEVQVSRLTDLPLGASATVESVGRLMTRLSVLGVVPGTEVKLLQRAPSVVIRCDYTTIALETEIAREILVKN